MSTNPGATTSPSASTVRAAVSSTSPIATTCPSRIPTSARRRAAPVPSTTLPPTIFTSSTVCSFSSSEVQDLGGFVGRGDGAADVRGQGGGVPHELLVGRLSGSAVVLQPDPDVTAALERDAGDPAVVHVATQDRDGPGHVAVPEQLEVRVERNGSWAEPEAGQEALVAAEVELDHRPGRQAPGAPPGEDTPEEPGLVDRDARPEPVPRAQPELVGGVVERVGVHDPRRRQPVRTEAAEVDRPGIAE